MKMYIFLLLLFLSGLLIAQEKKFSSLVFLPKTQKNFSQEMKFSLKIKKFEKRTEKEEFQSRIPHIIFSVLFPLVASREEYFRYREFHLDRSQGERANSNSSWHKWSWFTRVTGVSLGVSIGLHSKFNLKKLLIDLLFSGSVFWNTFDASLNIQRGLPVFNTAIGSGSPFEKFNVLKLPVLIASVFLYFLE